MDGEQLATPDAVSAGSGTEFTTAVEPATGSPRGLTVVWQTGADPLGWRSSTVLL